MENDTETGGESLSIDQAAQAFAKATAPKEAPTSQSGEAELEQAETDDELQAAEDVASETDDGETADEGQAADEDGEEQDSDQGRFVASNGKVKLPDGTVSTVAELIQGNLRDRDYRQKTMKHAEDVRSFTAQSAAIKERETQLEQQSKYVTDLLRAIVPAAPSPELLRTDPVAYMEAEASHKQWVQHLQYLDSQQQKAQKDREAEAAKTESETTQREWEALLKAVPSFKDEAKVRAFAEDAKKFGAEYGFSPDEVRRAVLLDHRQAVVLRKAIAWDKLQASKATLAKKVEGRPPVQRGGKRLSPGESQARLANDALADLKKSGSVQDAARAYLATRKTG